MSTNRDLLDEALARGVITDAQRAELAALAGAEGTDNEERIKPVGTLNEIFVTFGAALLLGAISGLAGMFLKNTIATTLATVATCWLVALYFHDRKRFRLPVIYACIKAAFVIFFGTTIAMNEMGYYTIHNPQDLWVQLPPWIAAIGVLIAGAARFRIPFLMLPIAIAFTVIVTIAARAGAQDTPYKLLLGACGLSTLVVAIWFDLKDPHRVKRWSDFAFWSYVVGSPLFVHSLFLSVLTSGDKDWIMSGGVWVSVLALTVLVSFVGLLLNRRALILSTLIYVGFVIFRLLTGMALGGPATILLVSVLLIGLYVTALGSRWTQVRAHIMRKLPVEWTWLKKLPPF